jgi:hypothetical protein
MVGVIAFVGAVLGSALGYLGAARATRVERLARHREEWGRRFTLALDMCLSSNKRARQPGMDLLVLLSGSKLASDEERSYVDAVLAAFVRTDREPRPRRIRSGPPDEGNQA